MLFSVPDAESCYYYSLKGTGLIICVKLLITALVDGFPAAMLVLTGYGLMLLLGGILIFGLNYMLASLLCGSKIYRVIQLITVWGMLVNELYNGVRRFLNKKGVTAKSEEDAKDKAVEEAN